MDTSKLLTEPPLLTYSTNRIHVCVVCITCVLLLQLEQSIMHNTMISIQQQYVYCLRCRNPTMEKPGNEGLKKFQTWDNPEVFGVTEICCFKATVPLCVYVCLLSMTLIMPPPSSDDRTLQQSFKSMSFIRKVVIDIVCQLQYLVNLSKSRREKDAYF